MWLADLYCDFQWVSDRRGVLGSRRIGVRGRSASLGISIDFHIFGDDHDVRHIRVLMHTDDQKVAETCVDLNIQTWVAQIECSVMMETRRPFHVAYMPGTFAFAVALGKGKEDSPAVVIDLIHRDPAVLRYDRIAYGMGAWVGDTNHHLFYFRRFIDTSLPIDVRWLNGYRLLEWHFVPDGSSLGKSPPWRQFAERFRDAIAPSMRPNQTCHGVLEEARAITAHAGMDRRTDAERRIAPQNVMEKTFHALEQMVMAVLNEHPARSGNPVSFEPHSPSC